MPSPDVHSTQSSVTWTCWGCDHDHADTDDMPQFCPKCGGVWVRPVAGYEGRVASAQPWWRLWLRHPIRETKWWWRYAR